jgi:hypothetical protein
MHLVVGLDMLDLCVSRGAVSAGRISILLHKVPLLISEGNGVIVNETHTRIAWVVGCQADFSITTIVVAGGTVLCCEEKRLNGGSWPGGGEGQLRRTWFRSTAA